MSVNLAWTRIISMNMLVLVASVYCCIPNEQFTCNDQSCIPLRYQCDGEDDCDDKEDERNCNITCLPNQAKCDYFDCIPAHWWCDGQTDCPDLSDERNCPPDPESNRIPESIPTSPQPNPTCNAGLLAALVKGDNKKYKNFHKAPRKSSTTKLDANSSPSYTGYLQFITGLSMCVVLTVRTY